MEREHFKLALIQTSLCDSREQWCVQILILEQMYHFKTSWIILGACTTWKGGDGAFINTRLDAIK